MELATEVASHVAKATADPMEDLGSLWATCSHMRRACGTVYVGQSIPLEPMLNRVA